MILTAKDISARLANQAEGFVQYLLPNGKREGAEWCVGSVDGEQGKSLKIRISGDRAGVWADFAGTDKGDLLDLIVATRRLTMGEAIKFAKGWLGIVDPENIVPRKKYGKPAPKGVSKPKKASPIIDYLVKQRKLFEDIIRMYRISESNDGKEIAFPSFSPEGELINVKYIAIARDAKGKKIVRQEKGCAPSLFGWHALTPGIREVVLTEGQIDAMTWRQFGFDAMSVPDGVANDEWIDYDWDNLQQFDTIYLSYDNDEPGQKAVQKVANRLGLHRCLIVKLEEKDANDALAAGRDADYFTSAIGRAKAISPEQIKVPSFYRNKLVERFYPPNGLPPGFFPEMFNRKMGFRPGETTIWSGISGHGKSALLSQLMLEAMLCGEKVAIASMEMPGEQTLHRMICQSELKTVPPVEDIDKILSWLSGKLWIYDLLGNVHPKVLFDLMDYSHCRHGVSQFVVDSLMKVSVGSDDYDAQRVFLNDVCGFSKKHMVHVHLVAHSRKGRDETDAPGKLDVKGSSDIINQPDNIMVVWRNKEKEIKKREGKLSESEKGIIPDAVVMCEKQRETGYEFAKKLRFLTQAFRFLLLDAEEFQQLSITHRIYREQGEEPPSTNTT